MVVLTERQRSILQLLKRNNYFQNGESIAIFLGISSRTVRNEIKALKEVLKDFGAKIISQRGLGYRLEITDYNKFRKINEQIRIDSPKFTSSLDKNEIVFEIIGNIIKNNLIGEVVFLQDISDNMYLSISTIKNYLPLVNDEIKKFNLSLSMDRFRGIEIVGDEDSFRYLISEYIFRLKNEYFRSKEMNIFHEDEIQKIRKIVLELLNRYNLFLTDAAIDNFIVHIWISLKRSVNNKTVFYKELEIMELKNTTEFTVASELIERIKASMGIDVTNEIYYYTQHLVSSNKLINNQLNPDELEYLNQIVDDIFLDIKNSTKINFTDDIELRNNLIVHLSVALRRIKYKMNIRNELLEQVKADYPLAFEIAVIAGNKIFENTGLKINQNEIGYIAMHFGAALVRMGKDQISNIKKILIVCGSGLATTSLIKERIKGFFGSQINIIETTSLLNLSKDMVEEADLVLSTVPIENIKSKKIKIINPLLNDKELKKIKKYVFSNQLLKYTFDLHELFKKDLFFKGMEFKDKYQVLNYLTDSMIQKGYIDHETKMSIFKREEIASTEIGQLIAIPHALENNMADASISVCVLRNPIIWDKEKVQVVFVLSIPKTKAKTYESIFRMLYKFLIDEFGVSKLVSEYGYEDLINNLNNQLERVEINGRNSF